MNILKRPTRPALPGFGKCGKLLSALLLFAMLWGCVCAVPVFAGNGKGNTEPEELHTDSPLYGKSALFCGDSICAAAGYDYSNMTRWGWAGRIARDYGMTWENRGADGASISNVRENNTVIAQLQGASKNYDFIILHGGTNDGWDEAPVGKITPDDNRKQFDISSFAGGLEQLFAYAKRVHPRAKIGYIINFQTPSSFGTLNDMSAYYDMAKKICEKWEIPYLDLYNDEYFNQKVMQVKSGRFTADKIHPNGKGYDRIYPYVAAFMEELAVEEAADLSSEVGELTSGEISSDTSSEAASEGAGDESAKKEDSKNSTPWALIIAVAACIVVACGVAGAIIGLRKKKR